MRYLTEFRDPEIAQKLVSHIHSLAEKLPVIKIMEVCGTHTMAIHRYGIRQTIPSNIQLLSGPGCPVCVTPNDYIDKAIAYARKSDVIITTFGDMIRVPGSTTSLEKIQAESGDVRIVYSTLDALSIAKSNPDKKVIFLGVGFETTAPTIAASIIKAQEDNIHNYLVLCAHKTIPTALKALAVNPLLQLDGFLCPAHVSAIIGLHPYEFIANDYHKGCVVTGFEPLDILQGIILLLKQKLERSFKVENEYYRVVKNDGNRKVLALLDTVFEPVDTVWRGIGMIPKSGLRIRKEFQKFDSEIQYPILPEPTKEPDGCLCGEVLQGIITPENCPLFGKVCTPETPVGACMVSSEGTCAAFYKYQSLT